jgi:Flp pilus assembly protein TadD
VIAIAFWLATVLSCQDGSLQTQSVSDLIASGNLKTEKADLDAACRDFSKALELDAKSAQALNGRAIARERKGDIDGALADFTKAIELSRMSYSCATAPHLFHIIHPLVLGVIA